jgi:hypothetical protein
MPDRKSRRPVRTFMQCFRYTECKWCGSGMFIPDPESRVDKIPDSGPSSKNLIIFNSKNYIKFLIRFGMFVPDPGFGFFSIPDPDPGSRDQKSTGSRIRMRNTSDCRCFIHEIEHHTYSAVGSNP